MALSERDRRAVLMGGVGLGLVVLYLLVIEPLASGYAGMVAEHGRLAGQVARAVYSQKKNAYLARQVAEYEEKNGSLTAPKPFGEQISVVGEQIVAAAQARGVQLKGTTPAAGTAWQDDPTLEMAVVRIEAEAEWEKTFEFIAALYRVSGVLSVEQLEMTSDPKKGGKITLRLAVSVLASKTTTG
jgi:type II secretory pathway component PulM